MTIELVDVLNELPANAAIVGPDGTIAEVNEGWRRFAAENGLDDGIYGRGSNYLKVCAACATDDPFAEEASQALSAVLDGRLERFAFTYPCHSAHERRWFFCLFLAVPYGAVVLHFNHLQQMDGHRLMRDATSRIRRFFGVVPETLFVGPAANDDAQSAAHGD